MTGQCGRIAQDDKFHAGTRDGDIHPAQVVEKTNLAFLIGTDQADDDDVAFLALETIDCVHADEMFVRSEEASSLEQAAQVLHLSLIG